MKTYRRTNNKSFSGTYAAMMTAVAVQEWAQYFIWKRIETGSMECHLWGILVSILTMIAAETVPLPLLASSMAYSTNLYASRMRQMATWIWCFQFFLVLICVRHTYGTHHYCVDEGLHHHQVWLCESATYAVGGHWLQFSFYWLYVVSCMFSAEAMTGTMQLGEIRRLQTIGLVSAFICIVMYGETLEACAIWCWSAFILGVCLCAQVYGYMDELGQWLSRLNSRSQLKVNQYR
jgi:hypothetical protein